MVVAEGRRALGAACGALALGLSALVTGGFAAETGAEPVYSFRTILVPRQAPALAETYTLAEGWASGGLFTERSGRLDRAITSVEGGFSLPEGQFLALARSRMLIGCTIDRVKMKSGLPHVCLADADGDGQFDSWFPFFDEIVLFAYVRKAPLAKMKPVAPARLRPVDEASLEDVRPEVGFELVPRKGRLEFCRTVKGRNDGYCTHAGPTFDSSGQSASIRAFGGEFAYRRLGDRYEVKTITLVRIQAYGAGS
jgi:hypothetical protein